MKTQAEYLALKGIHCPDCGSSMLSGDPLDAEAGTATQDVICIDCGACWTDHYTLTSFEDFYPKRSTA